MCPKGHTITQIEAFHIWGPQAFTLDFNTLSMISKTMNGKSYVWYFALEKELNKQDILKLMGELGSHTNVDVFFMRNQILDSDSIAKLGEFIKKSEKLTCFDMANITIVQYSNIKLLADAITLSKTIEKINISNCLFYKF